MALRSPRQEPVVQRSLECLRRAVSGEMDNLYAAALLSYTFTLAGDQDTRSKLITYLHQKSSAKGKPGGDRRPPLANGRANGPSSPLQAVLVTGTVPRRRGKVWTPWRWRPPPTCCWPCSPAPPCRSLGWTTPRGSSAGSPGSRTRTAASRPRR